jgi:hypothetical protein
MISVSYAEPSDGRYRDAEALLPQHREVGNDRVAQSRADIWWRPFVTGATLTGALAMAVSVSDAAPAVTKRGMEADTILLNGDIYTESGANPRAGVVAIRGRKFVYVGSRQDNGWREWVGRDTRIVDLHGRMVIPGITDSHTHPGLVVVADERTLQSRFLGRPIFLPDNARYPPIIAQHDISR